MTVIAFPDNVRRSLKAVLDYDIPTERSGYERSINQGDIDPAIEGEPRHVYEHLMLIAGWLEQLDQAGLNVAVVETGASFDNLYAFDGDETAERFVKLRQISEDVKHGATPILNDAFVCAVARTATDEDEFGGMFEQRGVDLREVPDDQILACLDEMPDRENEEFIDWLNRWTRSFKGEGS